MDAGFVCTGCGSASVEINRARPSVDDRYPLGHCVGCTPWPKPVDHPLRPGEKTQPPRKTIALIRADLFDRADFDHRRKVEEARRLAKKLTSKSSAKMSKEEIAAAQEAVSWLQRA